MARSVTSVAVDILHPFGEIFVGLHGVLRDDLVAHRDDGRKDDDQNGDHTEKAAHRDERDLLFLLLGQFLLAFAVLPAVSRALLSPRRVLPARELAGIIFECRFFSARELVDILHFPPHHGTRPICRARTAIQF